MLATTAMLGGGWQRKRWDGLAIPAGSNDECSVFLLTSRARTPFSFVNRGCEQLQQLGFCWGWVTYANFRSVELRRLT